MEDHGERAEGLHLSIWHLGRALMQQNVSGRDLADSIWKGEIVRLEHLEGGSCRKEGDSAISTQSFDPK
jgi:hypothetical protein